MAFNRIDGTVAGETIDGTEGDDLVLAGGGNDIVRGKAGNDNMSGQDGDDTLYGGAGNDSIGGNDGEDVLYGEDGNDVLWGVNGGDRIFGGVGNDDLNGGEGNDLLEGGDGDDRLVGEIGDDRLVGGRGNDRYFGGKTDPGYSYGYTPGNDSVVIGSDVAQATLDFAAYRATASWYPSPLEYSTLFVISPDGVDTLDAIRTIEFNDAQTSGYVVGFYQTFATYELFMNRKPSTAEYVFWNNQEVSQRTVREAILASSEGQAAFAGAVDDTYRMFVGRAATAEEIGEQLTTFRQTGGTTLQSMRESVIADHAGEVAQTVTDAYQSIAGRLPTVGEIATWQTLFGSVRSYASAPWGYQSTESFATTDTLVAVLLIDPGTSGGGRVLQLRGTTGADVFTLPANFTNVRITGFDPTQDRISFAGTAFAATDPLDPAGARQVSGLYKSSYDNGISLTEGGVLLTLDATHRVLIEGAYGSLDREAYLSRSNDTIDTFYQRYFDRVAMVGETATWDRLFADGATFDTLVDALLVDGFGVTAGTQHLRATGAADRLSLAPDFGDVVIEGFDPAADTLSLRGTAFAGTDLLAHARDIVGLDGRTDVLVALDATHTLLFDNLALAQLSSSNFLI